MSDPGQKRQRGGRDYVSTHRIRTSTPEIDRLRGRLDPPSPTITQIITKGIVSVGVGGVN